MFLESQPPWHFSLVDSVRTITLWFCEILRTSKLEMQTLTIFHQLIYMHDCTWSWLKPPKALLSIVCNFSSKDCCMAEKGCWLSFFLSATSFFRILYFSRVLEFLDDCDVYAYRQPCTCYVRTICNLFSYFGHKVTFRTVVGSLLFVVWILKRFSSIEIRGWDMTVATTTFTTQSQLQFWPARDSFSLFATFVITVDLPSKIEFHLPSIPGWAADVWNRRGIEIKCLKSLFPGGRNCFFTEISFVAVSASEH